MTTKTKRLVLVVGASSGFGAAILQYMSADGFDVIGTSRRAPSDAPIDLENPVLQCLDVRDDASVSALLARLQRQNLSPDVIVLNAGFGIAGPVEETPVALAEAQFATNFFGLHRVVLGFLPLMRQRRSGQLIFIGSIAGQLPLPFQTFYSASKAALAAYSDALRMEVMAHGIKVSLVEPGDHNTAFGEARTAPKLASDSPYLPQAAVALAEYEKGETNGAPAHEIAVLVTRIAHANQPKPRYVKGNLIERGGLGLRALLSGRLFERVMMSAFKIPR